MWLKRYSKLFVYCLSFFCLTGCEKQTSYYYADETTPGTAIFSNTGNNVLSCLIDGKSWRTITRKTGGTLFGGRVYEVFIERHITNSALDTLSIIWLGDIVNGAGSSSSISLVLPVAKNFIITDLSAMQNKRISIDSSNGFFNSYLTGFPANTRGKGSIYFNRLSFQSLGANAFAGNIAGLLEADFGPFTIQSARFDHFINPDQVNTY